MNLKFNIKSVLSALVLGSMAMTSCVDELPDNRHVTGPTLDDVASLVFDFSLAQYDSDGGTSPSDEMLDHGEAWENYINPALFRILFFDNEGNYLFEADRRFMSVISKSHEWNGSSDTYRVTIPQKDLQSEREGDAPRDTIQEVLFNRGFKVVVLANWPSTVENQMALDPETGDPVLGNSDIPTDLDFVYDPTHEAINSHLSYFSHCIFDNVYGRYEFLRDNQGNIQTDEDGNPLYSNMRYGSYEHLIEYIPGRYNLGGRMGVYSNWVTYLYKNQAETATFIRKGEDYKGSGLGFDIEGTITYNIEKDVDYGGEGDSFWYKPYGFTRYIDKDNEYVMENIWRLWNFSAGDPNICPYHKDCTQRVKDYWKARNTNALLYQLMNKSDAVRNSEGNYTFPKGFSVVQMSTKNSQVVYHPVNGTEGGYMEFPATIPSIAEFDDVLEKARTYDDKKPNQQREAQAKLTEWKNNCLHFPAYAEGQLRIRAKSPNGGGKICVITARPGIHYGWNDALVKYNIRDDESGFSHHSDNYVKELPNLDYKFEEGKEWLDCTEFLIQPNSLPYLDVYIFALEGDVDIYEVEYMRARHVYDNARVCIMPSAEHPIPFWGLQNFAPIGDYLEPNETFNMSDENENIYLRNKNLPPYAYRNIYLLRSVAKVELLFKESVFANNMPEHVMMRTLNRTARCEPTDVMNPTEWIWFGRDVIEEKYGTGYIDPDAQPEHFIGAENEWNTLINFGPLRKPKLGDKENSQTVYRNKTAWFYGSWIRQLPDLPKNKANKYCWYQPWNWNNCTDVSEDQVLSTGQQYEFPRIFNSRINRVDFCRMHRVPSKNGYIRYIMYMPEKNIDDTNDIADVTALPKVAHVEVRFKDMNGAINFDDNEHYRIYFTNYDQNGLYVRNALRDGNSNNTFDQTERADNLEFLKKLQPVMRNCHYKFYINSINDYQLGVNMSVCGAATRNGQEFKYK